MTDSFIQGLDLTGLTVPDRLVYSDEKVFIELANS
jgi:hypothetical protein